MPTEQEHLKSGEEAQPERAEAGDAQTEQEAFRAFVAEVEAMRERERQEGAKTAHFTGYRAECFSPAELTVGDMEMWRKIQAGNFTREELRDYQDEVGEEAAKAREKGGKGTTSREVFAAFLANKAMPILIKRELAELDGQKGFSSPRQ